MMVDELISADSLLNGFNEDIILYPALSVRLCVCVSLCMCTRVHVCVSTARYRVTKFKCCQHAFHHTDTQTSEGIALTYINSLRPHPNLYQKPNRNSTF